MKYLFLCLCLVAFSASQAEEQLELFPKVLNNQKLVEQFAKEMGEYFSSDESYGYLYTELVTEKNVPKKLEMIVSEEMKSYYEKGADFGLLGVEVTGYWAITNGKTTEVIGYVVELHDYFDHPLWAGSGEALYYDNKFNLVKSIHWEG